LPGRRVNRPRAEHPEDRVALIVGATEPHKNQSAAVRAMAQVRRHSGADLRLRVVGPPGRAEHEVSSVLREVDPQGAWTKREIGLTDDEVDRAYESAWVLLQPSLNEGYGLPLVEAAQRGLPVVHSGCGAMSEVLPFCSAGGPTVTHFRPALQALLDRAVWDSCADAVYTESGRFTWDSFRASVGRQLRDL
jgi:glycosyltransferase involved in cell wall biosynthesis